MLGNCDLDRDRILLACVLIPLCPVTECRIQQCLAVWGAGHYAVPECPAVWGAVLPRTLNAQGV
jgi:hypothetical protein